MSNELNWCLLIAHTSYLITVFERREQIRQTSDKNGIDICVDPVYMHLSLYLTDPSNWEVREG